MIILDHRDVGKTATKINAHISLPGTLGGSTLLITQPTIELNCAQVMLFRLE